VFCLSINVLSKGKLYKCLLLARQSANNFDEIVMAEHNKLFVVKLKTVCPNSTINHLSAHKPFLKVFWQSLGFVAPKDALVFALLQFNSPPLSTVSNRF